MADERYRRSAPVRACARANAAGSDRIAAARWNERPREAVPRRPRAEVGDRVGGRRHLPLRRHGARGRGLRHRHAAAHRQRHRCTSGTCSPTPTPTPSPATSACGARRSSTRWGGTTTGCPPSAGSRTTSASRCDPSLPYDAGFEPPDEPPQAAGAGQRPNFVELCHRLTAEDEQAFEDLFRRLGLSVDWSMTCTRPSTTAARRASQARLPAQPGRGARPTTAEAPDHLGRRLPHRRRPGRARGPRAARRLPPHRLPPPATAARPSTSRPPGPS